MRRRRICRIAVVLFCLVGVLPASLARADMLTGTPALTGATTIYSGGTSQSVLVTPMNVTNLTTGQTLLAFCGDFTVSTSPAFGSSTGQAYGAHALFSPTLTIYSELQKSQVNDLFSYAYATAFDYQGNVTNVTNARAFQLTLWELLTETDPMLDILTGNFRASVSGAIATTTNAWLGVLAGASTWDLLGLTAMAYDDLTVYVADGGVHASQTLISITCPPPPPVVPEPATMLIFGIGAVAAAPFLRRRKT